MCSTFCQQCKSHLCLQRETETDRNHNSQALIKGARTKSQFGYDPHEMKFSICIFTWERAAEERINCSFITEEPVLTLCKFSSIKRVLCVTASPGSYSLHKWWIIHYILAADAQNKASTFLGLPNSSQGNLALLLQPPGSLGAVWGDSKVQLWDLEESWVHLARKDQANSSLFLQLSVLCFGSAALFIGVIMNCQRSSTAE